MAVLSIPERNFQTNDVTSIRAFFVERNIFFDQWSCDVEFQNSDVMIKVKRQIELRLLLFLVILSGLELPEELINESILVTRFAHISHSLLANLPQGREY